MRAPEDKRKKEAIPQKDRSKHAATPKPPEPDLFCRAANEDDDGYDPWSDRKESPPLWEEDPWR